MDFLLFATFFVALFSSILSGIAGGGGGFIVAPYWLIAGFSPAQGATIGAFMALGMGGGSLAAFRGKGYLSKHSRLVLVLLGITLLASLVGPFFLHRISAETFKPILAIITLASLPFLFLKPADITPGRGHRVAGLILLALLLLASSFMTSSAFSILMSIVLLRVFRLSVLEGTAMRRVMGMVQSAVIFIILFSLGNFIWIHAIAGIIGGIIGSYLGTRFALRRGEEFAKIALAIGAGIGAVLLLI